MLTLIRTTTVVGLIGLQSLVGSWAASATEYRPDPSGETVTVLTTAVHPLSPISQKEFEPEDNGSPDRTSGAGGH